MGCTARDGMVVRKARALNSVIYNDFTLYSDNCTDEAIAKALQSSTNKIDDIKDIPNLYPNPTTGDIWIEFDKGLNGKKAYICIYNIIGSLVFRENISITNTIKITPDLEGGTYFISINTDDATIKNYNAKIIVIK